MLPCYGLDTCRQTEFYERQQFLRRIPLCPLHLKCDNNWHHPPLIKQDIQEGGRVIACLPESFPNTLNVCTERTKLLLHIVVTSINLADIPDSRFALCRQRGKHQGHTCAYIGTLQLFTEQLSWSLHETAIRITQNNTRSHAHQLIGEIHT